MIALVKSLMAALFAGSLLSSFSTPAVADNCILNVHHYLLGGYGGVCAGTCAAPPGGGAAPKCNTNSAVDAGGTTWYDCACGAVAPVVDCDATLGVKGNRVTPVCRVNTCPAPKTCVPFTGAPGPGQQKPVCDCTQPPPPPDGN